MTSDNQFIEHLPALKRDLDEWEREYQALGRRIHARRQLIAAVEADAALIPTGRLFTPTLPAAEAGTPPPEVTFSAPTLSTGEIVYGVVREQEKPISQRDIMAILGERGQLPGVANPRAAVGAALWYMANKSHTLQKYGTKKERLWGLPESSSQAIASEAPPDASAPSGEVSLDSGEEA